MSVIILSSLFCLQDVRICAGLCFPICRDL